MSDENKLVEIDRKVTQILDRLGKGDVSLATIALRVKILELVVYGGVSITLTGVMVSVLAGLLR